jgi:NAD(P)H-flavin reductase
MENAARFNDPLDRYFGQPIAKPDGALYGRHVVISSGVISGIEPLTHDTYALKVKCSQGELIRPQAGQYGTLKPEHMSKPRAYSFARAPQTEVPGEHTFLVRVLEGGLFSAWLFEKDRVGEALTISGPLGRFLLDDSNRPMLCIAGGSGMSAIYSILEDAALKKVERDAVFLYGARTRKDLYLIDEINEFGDRWHSGHTFEFVPVLSEEPEDSGWKGARGLVTDYMKSAYLDSGRIKPDNCTAFFCGPPPMVDLGIKVLTDAGMNAADIRYDKFEDARSPAPVIDNTKCVLCDECLMVRPAEHCINEIVQLSDHGGDGYKRLQPADTSGLYYNTLYIDDDECIRCYACVDVCPADAIHPDNDKTPKTLRSIHA